MTTTNAETVTVKLRWLDLTDADTTAGLLGDALEPEASSRAKERALGQLRIQRREGEQPLSAWCRVMHEENGLEYQQPAHPAIRHAYEFGEASLGRWIFWLA